MRERPGGWTPRAWARSLVDRARRVAGGDDHVDLVSRITSPLEASYLADGRTPVIAVALGSLRWQLLGLRADPSSNPFVGTARELLDGTHTSYEGSALHRHHERWHPASAAEVLGLEVGAGGPLGTHPPQSVALPWFPSAATVDPTERLAFVERLLRAESPAGGPRLGLAHGHKLFGPVAAELGAAEHDRYRSLVRSVQRDGFDAGRGGHIGVQLLASGDRCVVLLRAGIHRAAVAAALGEDPLVVAVNRRPLHVRREEAAWWPGVRSGLFRHDQALAVFDRFLAGSAPAGCAAPDGPGDPG